MATAPHGAQPLEPDTGVDRVQLRSLVARIAAGQQDALRPLYESTVALAHAIALRVLIDRSLAEDAVADTYLQVWRKAPHYDPERATVLGWISMIARSRAVDLKRRRLAQRELVLGRDPTVASADPGLGRSEGAGAALDSTSVVRAACASERIEQVRAAIEALPDAQRVAVETAFFGGLTHVEVAARLDVPLGTIKTRIRSGVALLRARLSGLDGDLHATDLPPGPLSAEGAGRSRGGR